MTGNIISSLQVTIAKSNSLIAYWNLKLWYNWSSAASLLSIGLIVVAKVWRNTLLEDIWVVTIALLLFNQLYPFKKIIIYFEQEK